MELPNKLLEQKVFITRSKIKEHMLIVMYKSEHEENLSPSLQTNHKRFETTIIFSTGQNGIFNVTDKIF